MSYWANVDRDNIVTEVILADEEFIKDHVKRVGGRWIEFKDEHKNHPSKGMIYDEVHKVFIQLRPSSDATFDEETAQWIIPTHAQRLRRERDQRLAETDWVVIRALEEAAQSGNPPVIPEEWVTYRQALRDVPEQPEFPNNAVWPIKP